MPPISRAFITVFIYWFVFCNYFKSWPFRDRRMTYSYAVGGRRERYTDPIQRWHGKLSFLLLSSMVVAQEPSDLLALAVLVSMSIGLLIYMSRSTIRTQASIYK